MKPWGGAVLAGTVWSLAFPHPSFALAGWLTPALLLALSHAPRARRIFALGYVAGLTHYLSSLYWVLHNPFLSAAIAGWLVLSAYCALFPAIWVWFCWKMFPVQDAAGLAEAWLRLRRMPLKYRVLWPLQCALAWVALECLRGWLLTGFPWNLLANSQIEIIPLALFASITGVLGVSLVVAWCSISILVATTGSAHLKGAERCKRIGIDAAPALGFLALALIISWLYTNSREQQITERGKFRIAMVQPSIPQQVIFNSYKVKDKAVERWEKMEKLTFEANTTKPDIIIWPEASAPVGVLQKLDGRRQYGAPIDELAQKLGTPMIVGTDEGVEEMGPGRSIFISYRRDDSQANTGRIYDRLIQKFSPESIFKDVDAIPYGVDFSEHLEQQVAGCRVLLAIVGERWADNPRLRDEGDFVRIEIEYGLDPKRDIRVIPVLVGNATMPSPDQLPDSLKSFALCNTIQVRPDPDFRKDMDKLIKSLVDVVGEESVGNKKSIRRYNSCLLLDRHGKVRGIYRKRHLVMFGEYVPLEKWFPFLRNFVPVEMSFVPGDGPKVFDLGKAKATPIICFEDVVFPMVRKAATEEVDFLINLTNDGWFGESNQQWQHARTAAFRAIETGRPLVRCTNNGLTCWVDRFGRIHKLEEADIYAPGIRVAEIPLVDHTNGRATFYQRTGDWLGWGSVLAFGLMLGWRFWPKKDSAGEPDMA